MGDIPVQGVDTTETADVIRMRELNAEITALLTRHSARLVVTNPRLSFKSVSTTASDKKKAADVATVLKKIGKLCEKYKVIMSITPDIEIRMTPTKEGDKCEQSAPANQ